MKFKPILFLIFLCGISYCYAGSIAQGPVVVVVGTRPEAIKLIPVYHALKAENIPTILLSTGQHADLLDEVFTLFGLQPDFDLKIMQPNQDLFHVNHAVLAESKTIYEKLLPSLVVVQGDTTSAFASALAAYYLKIPVAHVEAGLRTYNIYAPFPEEMNRQLLTRLATLHYAPTALAVSRLQNEGVKHESILLTGNTVVDALNEVRNRIANCQIIPNSELKDKIDKLRENKKKIILLTAHRRESFGEGLTQIFSSIKMALERHPDLHVIFPMHPNPAIRLAAEEVFGSNTVGLEIITPLPYQDLVYLLNVVDGVATDSGGIQEEAVSLRKTTLILRNETDRPEGLVDGTAILVGTNKEAILEGIAEVISRCDKASQALTPSPYGDGFASQRIATSIKHFLDTN